MIAGYLAVGNKCAVDFSQLSLPISQTEALNILWKKGFRAIEVDPIELAISYIGKSLYRRGASLSSAPFTVDCSSFIKWIYAQKGIWLPRHSVDQAEMGVAITDVKRGDLIFTPGLRPWPYEKFGIRIGHVGVASKNNTVIHATKEGVIETEFERFVSKGYIARSLVTSTTLTLECPDSYVIEWSGEVQNLILCELCQ